MFTIEDTVKFLGWKKLKHIIEHYTKTARMSIRTGTRTTSVLQSSTLVSLLVLAFAGAGVMTLSNAIGVIIGANIGSPMLPFLAAVIGFGEFEISSFSLPMLAIAWCALIFLKKEKHIQIAKLVIGIALLFVGLDFMKESVEALQQTFTIQEYAHLSLRWFGLLGIIVTIVLRSSGALGIMTLSALDGWLISFPASVAVIMGANIGTTFTAVLASLGGDSIKRQIALSHVVFNVVSWIIGIALFRQYIRFTLDVLWYENNLVMGNAMLNIIFNASTAIAIGFFVKPFTKFITRIIPSPQEEQYMLRTPQVSGNGTDIAYTQARLYALREDCKTLIHMTFDYNTFAFGLKKDLFEKVVSDKDELLPDLHDRDKEKHRMQYDRAREAGNVLLEYVIQLRSSSLTPDANETASRIEQTINDCFRSLKSTKNIYHDLQDLRESSHPILKSLFGRFLLNAHSFYARMYTIIDSKSDISFVDQCHDAREAINTFHAGFVNELTQLIRWDATDDIQISVLINLDHYLHQAAETLLNAVELVYGAESK